jgi:hypothetical protein
MDARAADDDDGAAEAQARNAALVDRHGRIPSYALWTADTVRDSEAWWRDFCADAQQPAKPPDKPSQTSSSTGSIG